MGQVILLCLGFAVLVPLVTWKLVNLPDPYEEWLWRQIAIDAKHFAESMRKLGLAAHEVTTHLRYFELTWRNRAPNRP